MTNQMPETDFMTLGKLAEKMRPLAGQVVLLYGTDLVRLHGVAEDSTDLYYITECRRNGLVWNSAVGGVTPIRDRLGEDYDVLEAQFLRDGIPARPFQVVRSVRFRRVWLEGEPAEKSDVRENIRQAFDGALDDLDRTAAWEARRRAQRLVDLTIDRLRLAGLSETELQSFRRQVSGHHTQAHDEAEAGIYAYPLDALQCRREVMDKRALLDIKQQFRAISAAAILYGYGDDLIDPVLEAFDFGICRARLGPDLLNDLRHICDELLDGGVPDYDGDRDDGILEVIARAVPMVSRFLGIWLERQTELTDLWAGRGSNMPVWWPAAAFCLANWKRYSENPELLALDRDQVKALREDLAVCRKGS